jgi:hypothetical protein
MHTESLRPSVKINQWTVGFKEGLGLSFYICLCTLVAVVKLQ